MRLLHAWRSRRAPQLTLAVGAHRTGTTHLQQSIENAAPALAAARCAVITPERLRPAQAAIREAEQRRIAAYPPPKLQLEPLYLSPTPSPKSVLVMEENLIGRMVPERLFNGRSLYPFAVDGLALFAKRVGRGPDRLALSIRDYGTFLESTWRHACMSGGYRRPDVFLENAAVFHLSWAELVQRLQAHFPKATVLVWPYEAYPGNATALLEALIGPASGAVRLIENRSNAAASNKTLERLAKAPQLQADQRRALALGLPRKSAEDAPLMFDAEQRARLSAMYETHKAQIQAMPGIRWID